LVPARVLAAPIEAISMAWSDCPAGVLAQSDNAFNCSTNLDSQSLYCAFSVAQTIDLVVGLELVVDLQHSAVTLPDYWRLGPIPDCRHDMLTAILDFSQATVCENPQFAGTAVQDFLPGEPRGLSSEARIKTVVFVPSPQTRTLSIDSTYLAVRLVLSNDRTVSVGSCSGCTLPACLVLNSVLVRRVAGAPGGDIVLATPAAGHGNWVTWRGGSGADCTLVPARRQTWGSIKSLYR
jgi:hypothetical protein